MSVAMIGDVHGCVRELREVLSRMDTSVERVVLLGDMVNRGPDSKGVLDLILELAEDSPWAITVLAGNHDLQLRRVLDDDDALNQFLRMGGAATIRSYVKPPYSDVLKQLKRSIPISHRRLLDSLEDLWFADGIAAIHDVRNLDVSTDTFVVGGHAAQRLLVPKITDRQALIDTGCGTISGGHLTCMYWPTKEWFQSSLAGL